MASFPIRLGVLAVLSVVVPTIAVAVEPGTASDLYGDPLPSGAIVRLGTVRLRTVQGVYHIAYSPDGRQLLSQADETVTIWDADSGRKQIETEGQRIGPLIWRGDGRGIILFEEGSDSYRFGEFTRDDLLNSKKRPFVEHVSQRRKPPDDERLYARAISPDGKYFVAERAGNGERSAAVAVWAVESGMPLAKLRVQHVLGPQQGTCHQILFSPESRFVGILCGSSYHVSQPPATITFVLYELATGKECARRTIAMPNIGDRRLTAALGPAARHLAVGGHDRCFRIYDLGPGGDTITLPTPKLSQNSSGWSAVAIESGRVFAAKEEGSVYVYDLNTGQATQPPIDVGTWINCLAVSPNGERLATNDSRGVIRQWDLATSREITPTSKAVWPIQQAHVLPAGHCAIMWGDEFLPSVWDLITGKELNCIAFPERPSDMGMAPDGRTLLARASGKLVMYDFGLNAVLPTQGQLSESKGRLQPCDDGRSLVFAHPDSVQIWDWPEGRLRCTIDLKQHAVRVNTFGAAARLSPDGKRVIIRTTKSGIVIWDLEKGALHAQLKDVVSAPMGFSAGRLVVEDIEDLIKSSRPFALLGNNGFITLRREPVRYALWDLGTGKISRSFGAKGNVNTYAVAIDPGEYVFASAEATGESILYEVATGLVRRRLSHDNIRALAFSPDGKRLLTAGNDTTGLVWDLSFTAAARDSSPAKAVDLDVAWNLLAEPNAEVAYDALIALASACDQAVQHMQQRLAAAPNLNVVLIDRLINDLESESFGVRQRATIDLGKFGRAAIPTLRAHLKRTLPLETKRRLTTILDRYEASAFLPEELRAVRSLEFLEHVATPVARKLINDLSSGEPTADLTIRANAAKNRLDRPKS